MQAQSVLKKRHTLPQTFQLFLLTSTVPYMIGILGSVNKQFPLKVISTPYIISRREMPSSVKGILLQLLLKG